MLKMEKVKVYISIYVLTELRELIVYFLFSASLTYLLNIV